MYGFVLISTDQLGIDELLKDMNASGSDNQVIENLNFPEWWAEVILKVIIVTGAFNCVIYFFKSLFLLAIYCYFKYWGGLQAVDLEDEEDEEDIENQAQQTRVKKMSTKVLNEKIEDVSSKKIGDD